MLKLSKAYFCGSWGDAASGRTIDVINPATRQPIGTIPSLSAKEVNEAIQFAHAAMPAWQQTPAIERSRILRKWYDLLLANTDELATILTEEQGKPFAEARKEIRYGAAYIEWFAEEAKRIYGETIPAPTNDRRVIVIKQPVGVCAAITPWNFPNAMIARKVGPALAAGCAILVKPARQTPLSALAMAKLAQDAGLPAGLLSVLTGESKEIAPVLVAHPLVRKLTFTGSTEVGKSLLRGCADTVKKVTMELGGNAPFIVFDDADIDTAVEGAIASKFRNSGQTCVCANRFFIQRGVYDAFAQKLTDATQRLQVGNGFEPNVDQGPLIDHAALEKVESLVADAIHQGANVLTGGTRHPLGGTFYTPTVLSHCRPHMNLAQEEIFGPVASLFQFDTEEEVIRLANDTNVGLASYFYSRDIGRIWHIAEALEYGMVGINTGILSNPATPFGGIKESGIGREGSRHGIEDYLEMKYLCMAGL